MLRKITSCLPHIAFSSRIIHPTIQPMYALAFCERQGFTHRNRAYLFHKSS